MSVRGIIDGFPMSEQVGVLQYLRSGAASAPGLAIKAAGNADAKTDAFSFRLGGKVYSKAALATLSLAGLGVVAAGGKKTAFLAIDATGTVTLVAVAPDGDGVTTVPEPTAGTCLFGAVTVANGSAAAFTAGTTLLDAAGLTVTYTGLSGIVPGEAL
uniref:Uncharacterized protein n=1 Tax=Desulfovibrio sp. U5L TaxID=596152 RepID=I2Q1E1_9BACT